MTAIHQFVPALLPRDATGDHTLALRDTLRAAGFESDIYVEAAHDDLWPQATYFEEYPDRSRPDDLLVYQLSTASPVAEFLLGRSERLVLDYHNITPAHFYESWEDHTTAKVTLARHQARALAPVAVLGIADSAFNAAELDALGCPSTAVIPILVALGGSDGMGAPADRRALDRLGRDHGSATVLLFVGRLSPNKGQHRLVEALWLYRRWYEPDARLHLVGPASTPDYARAVFELADGLGLADAVRHGEDLSDGELAAWYADADVFVCASEHEGFCIPLLEAMHAGLPIVAFGAGAVPETLGDAGILLDAARPGAMAAAVDRVVGDPGLSGRLADAGRQRLQAYDPETTRARFVDVLGALATGHGVPA